MLLIIFLFTSTVVTVNSLQCIFGGHGVVNEKSGTINDTKITCSSQTKFCLKLKSDTTVNGEHVKGFARGCDQEMPGSSKHEFCKTEGCTSKHDTRGITQICCCANDFCNDGTRNAFIFAVFFTTIFCFSILS